MQIMNPMVFSELSEQHASNTIRPSCKDWTNLPSMNTTHCAKSLSSCWSQSLQYAVNFIHFHLSILLFYILTTFVSCNHDMLFDDFLGRYSNILHFYFTLLHHSPVSFACAAYLVFPQLLFCNCYFFLQQFFSLSLLLTWPHPQHQPVL